MVDLKINLLEKQQVNPAITLWRRRLYLILAIVSVILLFDGIAVLFVRTVLLARSKDLQTHYNQLVGTIEEKKEVEGLYLTLQQRLNSISSMREKGGQLERLPEEIHNLLGESMKLEDLSIDHNKEIKLRLQADDQKAVETLLDKLTSFETENYLSSNVVIEKTEIDESGNYTINVKLSLVRRT